MKKVALILLAITFLVSSRSAVFAKEKTETRSFGVMFGVRQYDGQLPPEIKYKSLGEIEGKGHGGMVVEVLHDALANLTAKAKTMGANAVINIKTGDPTRGEAIIAESFPDVFSEEDFEGFKGPKEYSQEEVFKYDYTTVFEVVEGILKRELYDIVVSDASEGIIETKPIEIPTGKTAWTSADTGGPYPVMKLLINIEDMGSGQTEVAENYIFLKGTVWKESVLEKNNKTFFKEIKDELKKSK